MKGGVLWLCRTLFPVLADPKFDAGADILDFVFGSLVITQYLCCTGFKKPIVSGAV